eukprot:XP_028348374.1 proline-rich protein HaeIII subfamily 1 [Physeter catodon]
MGVGSKKKPHSQSAQDPYDRGSTREPATPRREWGPRQSPTLRVTRTPRGASRADPRGVAAGAVPPRCHPEAETMPGARTRDRPVSPPLRPRPTGAQGGGRQLGQRPRGAPLGPATPGGDPSPAQDPCRLGPPSSPGTSARQPRPARGPRSSRGPPPGLGPLPPESPARPGTPARPETPDPPARLGPLPPGTPPGPGTLSQPRNPCPPGTPARPGPAARRLTSGRLPGSAHSLPEVPWPSETEPSSPQSRSSGSVSHSARSSCRREVATGVGQRAGALAPPAPLRPAPGGARRSGPAPQPMERELREEGGAWRNKGRQNL